VTRSVPEQESNTKGSRVWLDMDQKELDDAYDQSAWAPNQSHVSGRRVLWSESIRARLKPERIAYGPTEIEQVDI
jgi:arylformamidase